MDGSDEAPAAPAPLRVAIPPTGRLLAPIRALVANWLSDADLDSGDWPLVVTELLTNSLLLTSPDEVVELDMAICDERVVLTVSDPGPGFELIDKHLPLPTSHRGRGLGIVSALTDEIHAERVGGRTVVTCSGRAHARFPEMTRFLDDATHDQNR